MKSQMFVHFDCSEVGLSMYQKCTTTNHLKKKFLGVEPFRVPYQDARLWLCHSHSFGFVTGTLAAFFLSSSGVANVHPTRKKPERKRWVHSVRSLSTRAARTGTGGQAKTGNAASDACHGAAETTPLCSGTCTAKGEKPCFNMYIYIYVAAHNLSQGIMKLWPLVDVVDDVTSQSRLPVTGPVA